MEPIVNRVAESEIVVYNLEDLWDENPVTELDIAPFLYKGLVLKEKEFREQLKTFDWPAFAGQHVTLHCSTDAIVPTWAYMLLAVRLNGIARSITYGRLADLTREHFARALEAEDWSRFADRIVVVKGCGSKIVPVSAYVSAMQKLQQVARKVMYGEPCSSVPLWRQQADPAAPSGVVVRPAVTGIPAVPGTNIEPVK